VGVTIIQVLKLISDIPISVNQFLKPRAFITYYGGTPRAQVTMYETAEAKAYKKKFAKHIKEQVKLQKWKKLKNRFQKYYVDCTFYFPKTNMDTNNMWKLMLDAVSESLVVWEDDVQSCERVQGIFYDTANPRVEITIHPVDFVGIFPTIKQLQSYESNCITCKRYKNNCSILTKAKEGRIQTDVQEFTCAKYKKIK